VAVRHLKELEHRIQELEAIRGEFRNFLRRKETVPGEKEA
jgi:hypothetical protein